MKNIVIVLLASLLVIGTIVGGFMPLTKHIYNRSDCERFNIDNIEVRTGINIPAISDAECSCDEIKKTKFSKFTLNEEEVNIEGWIVTNGLKLEQDLYFRQGKNKHTIWEATFDPASNELEIKIEYL